MVSRRRSSPSPPLMPPGWSGSPGRQEAGSPAGRSSWLPPSSPASSSALSRVGCDGAWAGRRPLRRWPEPVSPESREALALVSEQTDRFGSLQDRDHDSTAPDPSADRSADPPVATTRAPLRGRRRRPARRRDPPLGVVAPEHRSGGRAGRAGRARIAGELTLETPGRRPPIRDRWTSNAKRPKRHAGSAKPRT